MTTEKDKPLTLEETLKLLGAENSIPVTLHFPLGIITKRNVKIPKEQEKITLETRYLL